MNILESYLKGRQDAFNHVKHFITSYADYCKAQHPEVVLEDIFEFINKLQKQDENNTNSTDKEMVE
jgi:hypothetical protein